MRPTGRGAICCDRIPLRRPLASAAINCGPPAWGAAILAAQSFNLSTFQLTGKGAETSPCFQCLIELSFQLRHGNLLKPPMKSKLFCHTPCIFAICMFSQHNHRVDCKFSQPTILHLYMFFTPPGPPFHRRPPYGEPPSWRLTGRVALPRDRRMENHPKPACDYGAEQSHLTEWLRARLQGITSSLSYYILFLSSCFITR